MTMVRLGAYRRALFAEKLLDLANYAATALVFGQCVAQAPISSRVMIAGVATWLVFAAVAASLAGER